jgi:tetratricopeptide (TPR) repeat protein
MNTHPRCLLAFSLTSALTLSLLPTMACGGGSPGAAGDGPEATTGDEVEVGPSACEGQVLLTEASPQVAAPEDPLRCDELSTPAPVPLPTTASCRALGAEERAVCTARVRARARVTHPLGEARAAALASNWPEAIAKLEAAVVIVVDEPDVLAELGWARFRAREWCMATQDSEALEAERDSPSDGGEPSAIAVLCTGQVSLHQALEELELAANAAPSLELRATWEHQRAQVSAALGEEGDAAQAARRSLCARENPEVREMLAAQLWNTANRLGPAAPEESIGLYRQALMLAPSPEREEFVRDVLAVLGQPISFEAAPPVQPQAFFPSVEALCQALVLRDMTEPVDPSELPEDLCEVSDWDEVGLTRGEEVDVQFHAAVLTVQSPELYDGPVQTNYLVARSSRGVNVLLYLGQDHGDSRRHNAFVGSVATSYNVDNPNAPLVVTWDEGEAEAYDCDWQSRASTTWAACALVDGAPRCYAVADLGPAEFTSDSMLPTIQESLGNCDEGSYQPPQHQPSDFRPLFSLEVTAQELAATRVSDGAMLCLPLRETLSPLRQPAAGQ